MEGARLIEIASPEISSGSQRQIFYYWMLDKARKYIWTTLVILNSFQDLIKGFKLYEYLTNRFPSFFLLTDCHNIFPTS
jgi:hypothetical protein